MIYLDANATTAMTPRVREAVVSAMDARLANPSSAHWAGAEARAALTAARDSVCRLLPEGFTDEGIVLTSGGTEANNLVLRGRPAATIVTTAVEHPSVLRPAQASRRRVVVPVDGRGLVRTDSLREWIPTDEGELVVSVQWANSETGVIQPIDEIVRVVRSVRPDAFIHVDAAQAIGRIPLLVQGIDAITCSGHKLHAPAGTGFVAFADPDEDRVAPLLLGGGQERGYRSGTQNVVGAAGLGAAFEERADRWVEACSAMRAMRDAFEGAVLDGFAGATVNGGGAPRVANTTNIRFPGLDAMALVAALDQRDVACSVGSACSSGRPEPSHVLAAMGLSERAAYSSARFSFSVLNTMEEAARAAGIVVETAKGMA